MSKRRLIRLMTAMICLTLLGAAAAGLSRMGAETGEIPGLKTSERTLLRIWVTNAPGGGTAWLRGQLRSFEKQHPGVSTYLRQVLPEDLSDPDAVLPDILLFMPGDVTSPEMLLLPITGDAVIREDGLVREELLRCGRWQGEQYGLPLCWGAWVLAIDRALDPGPVTTPSPAALLGKASATGEAFAAEDAGYPLDAARQKDCALLSPGGAALFTLGMLLQERPVLTDDFAALRTDEVYAAFRQRQCATAMLTTGQATALTALVSGGGGFPFRVMTGEEIITDQVWLAGVTPSASEEAGQLLGYLMGEKAQGELSAQGLHAVRADMGLYAAGMDARIEQAAKRGLTAINAFIPLSDVRDAAWRFFQGTCELSEVLLPLL